MDTSNKHLSPMSSPHQSLLAQHLTPELYELLKDRRTSNGFTIDDVARSGRQNPDSSIGLYAGDAESYDLFDELFAPIIARYHGINGEIRHVTDFDASKIPTQHLDPAGTQIISTRIRVGRNLRGMPLAPAITREQRNEVMRRMQEGLAAFSGELEGHFYPLEGMEDRVREMLIQDHFLFKQGDRFLEAAGANRDWPEGRGIFFNIPKTALVWVNEEDQARIISMEQGGNIHSVFSRLAKMVAKLEEVLEFAYHPKYGALTSCPTNLGTAMRASVHVRLPNLSKNEAMIDEICRECHLSKRGINGEHSDSVGGVWDISNKRRLNLSEVEAVQLMYNGVQRLLEEERRMSS